MIRPPPPPLSPFATPGRRKLEEEENEMRDDSPSLSLDMTLFFLSLPFVDPRRRAEKNRGGEMRFPLLLLLFSRFSSSDSIAGGLWCRKKSFSFFSLARRGGREGEREREKELREMNTTEASPFFHSGEGEREIHCRK